LIKLTSDHVIYRFSKDIPPALEVDIGEILVLETLDAFSGRITKVDDAYLYEKKGKGLNPATGPIYVKGAEPGDTLVVKILDIEVQSYDHRALMKGAGVANIEKNPKGLIVEIKDNFVIYNEKIHLPLRPMVGVIGVAPAGEEIVTIHPGTHGGNMDINLVTVGTKVYLPVSVHGALLALGDLHASMGDGELPGGGIDINGEVTVKLGLIKGRSWLRPWLETGDSWATCSNSRTLEEAISIAAEDMIDKIVEMTKMSRKDAFTMIGAYGDAKIGQASISKVRDVDVTVYLVFPKILVDL